ncbi:MAG: nickel-dependent hydrogenase large subunit [Campylobacterota bacterium]|nr:nickel-dependent hydrogenase large subunit [Campylobacterota bacterium]
MITKKLIEQIEGEASLTMEMKAGKVDFVSISFAHFRAMEKMLEAKNALDALVITPRVCGICGHSHLLATVRALEDAYKNAGLNLELSPKAEKIREITLILELIQNHFKWFYLVIYPELSKLLHVPMPDSLKLKGAYGASIANRALALFSGQWPHSSYMIPGGITADPSHMELMRIEGIMDELIQFFERESMGVNLDTALSLSTCKDFNTLQSDISNLEKLLIKADMHHRGHAYDRFIVMGDHSFSRPSKMTKTKKYASNPNHVSLEDAFSPYEKSFAKNALYRNAFHEAGPLARAMSADIGLIKNMHRRFKDSTYSRVMARVFEIPQLLYHVKTLLHELDLHEPSFIKPPQNIQTISSEGIGVVEAPRGSLIHKVRLFDGQIHAYKIITPTQWNLGSSKRDKLGVAQKAMIGSRSENEASLIFKSFDVCSVCTTH